MWSRWIGVIRDLPDHHGRSRRSPTIGGVRRVPKRRAAVGVVVTTVLSFGVVAALSGGLGAATVAVPAERGVVFQATDTVPPPSGCARVIVIGDSLMDNAAPWLRSDLAAAGFDYWLDAQPSRRIPERVSAPYSGVLAARAARSTFGDADCWVVALGSNDLIYGGGVVSQANGMIDEMLGAVSPGASVWWVNVNYHRDPRTNYDFVRATDVFNGALDDRAAGDPDLHVVDWYTLSEAHLEWFFDPVHVGRAASIVRARFTVDALPPADRGASRRP